MEEKVKERSGEWGMRLQKSVSRLVEELSSHQMQNSTVQYSEEGHGRSMKVQHYLHAQWHVQICSRVNLIIIMILMILVLMMFSRSEKKEENEMQRTDGSREGGRRVP